MAMSEEATVECLRTLLEGFEDRHIDIKTTFKERFEQVKIHIDSPVTASIERELLIGAHFTNEYSVEAAALFNPSIVLHPDQTGLPAEAIRFILSLRATGEGHISSITFRTGIIGADDRVTVTPTVPHLTEPNRLSNRAYAKGLFTHKLEQAGVQNEFCRRVLDKLHDDFTLKELHQVLLASGLTETPNETAIWAAKGILLLAESNFEVSFPTETQLSQRILFPSAPSQSNGIEDARFVRFQKDDGTFTYYATYTAYDGKMIMPQLVETADFQRFKFSTMIGAAIQNKGLALFPRKIQGKFTMLSRQDDENILIMTSDTIDLWQTAEVLLVPSQPWEFIKLGNCGSPLETKAGWLVISHGVGAMRKYCLGAFLLDLNDPSRVLGRLTTPLLCPNESDRDGYVPNVIYSCGSFLHRNQVIIPYAMSDSATSFASIDLDELLAAMN
jgi:predicted GH43/DUF377 family glycosyl hydrolase